MFPNLLRDDVFRLETARLWLRWPRASDAAEIARLAGEAEVALATALLPHPYPAEAAGAFVLRARQENSAGKSLSFVLSAKRRPGVALGAIALADAAEESLGLGYWLGKPHWNQGLMSEAARAMVDLGFTWTAAPHIVATAQVDNSASRRVLEKCGFRLVGQSSEAAPARSGPRLVNHFSLRREEWTDLGGAASAPFGS
jgi:RimJ/RimL family protein N-acetyltransferase